MEKVMEKVMEKCSGDIDKFRPYFVSRVKPLNSIKNLFGNRFKELTSGTRICLFSASVTSVLLAKPSLVTFHTSGEMASRYAAMRTFQ